MAEHIPSKGRKTAVSALRRVRFWLLGTTTLLLVLLVAAALIAEYVLSLPAVRERIRQTIAVETGVAVEYQDIGLSYFPAPKIELRQLRLSAPNRLQGMVKLLRFSPDLSGVLTGNLRLGSVDLMEPEISLRQAAAAPTGTVQFSLPEFAGLLIAGLQLHVRDGRFTVASATGTLAGELLDLDLALSAEKPSSARAVLNGTLSRLQFAQGARQESVQGVVFAVTAVLADDAVNCRLERLALADPALELTGSFSRKDRAVSLNLTGSNIDVGATRAKALALAGDITPVKEIFSYLVGGSVPQISFDAQGKKFSDLGEWANFRLAGQLQNGSVSIPDLPLDLTEVNGEVTLTDGILSGSGLAARLEKSTGSAGTLAIGLKEESDLFRLDLMLNADLAQAQTVVRRLVDNTTVIRELDRFTQLVGSGTARLVLGDSFKDFGVRINEAAVKGSFHHQFVPLQVNITGGKVDLDKNVVTFRDMHGTVGQSEFSGLDCTLNWEERPRLEVEAKTSVLALDEIHPWLAGVAGVKPRLQGITAMRGRLQLSSARFKGQLDQSAGWQYGAAGALSGLVVTTPAFPSAIELPKGEFLLDGKALTVNGIRVRGLDGELGLNGKVTTWKALEVSLDGTLGEEAVGWLETTLSVPEWYHLRSPLTLDGAKLRWREGKGAAFTGNIAIAEGPVLSIEVEKNEQEELKLHSLKIKDQDAEAELTYGAAKDGVELGFRGALRHETMEKVFVAPVVVRGRLDGDLAVTIPKLPKTVMLARGRLHGAEMVMPFGTAGIVTIGQMDLTADGSQVQADFAKLNWHGYVLDPVKAAVTFGSERIDARVEKAGLCGIDGSGTIGWAEKRLALDATLAGKGLDVATSYTCLTQGQGKMTGTMDVTSRITAEAEPADLVGKLTGPLEVTFRDGEVRKGRLLSTILEVLNVTEIVKGRLPSLSRGGFAYNVIEIEGRFGNGKLHVDKLLMDGKTLGIVGTGEVDLEKATLKLELLAAPFRTVDSIIKYIPGVNYLLGGSLVAIPLKVSGTLAEPKVVIMSPSSVSKSLLNLAGRTVKLPFKLFESILPGKSK